MPSTVLYINGRYCRYSDALIHAEDRGFLFGDGVYEVSEVYQGKMVDADQHLARLHRSLTELDIPMPMSKNALRVVMREVARRNRVRDGVIYLQVTRGVAKRDHAAPLAPLTPTLMLYARAIDRAKAHRVAEQGVHALTRPDDRWGRVDIKSINLLPNTLARTDAKKQGAAEAIYVDANGFVTEGAATSIWIVDRNGVLKTRPNGRDILPGITKTVAERIALAEGYEVRHEAFRVDELLNAREVFMTAATTLVMPIVKVDDRVIANGAPGSVARTLREKYHDFAEIS